jgi:hypothetical protein
MGIRGSLVEISPEQLSGLVANPRMAYRHVAAAIEKHESEMLRKSNPNAKKVASPGLQLVKGKTSSEPQEELKVFSLEKDWHIFHYVLNGTAKGGDGPLADIVLGGNEIPHIDHISEYGPMRYLIPPQVKAIAEALAHVDCTKLAAKFDSEDAAAKGIYGVPRRPPQHMVNQYLQDIQNNPAAKKVMETRKALREAMLAKMPAEEREQERERARQNMEAFLNPQAMHFSPEGVAEFVAPVRDFYQGVAERGNAILVYIT